MLRLSLGAESLPGTGVLESHADLSQEMIAGIDRMALRRIEKSRVGRRPSREKLAQMLGLSDARVQPRMQSELLKEEPHRTLYRFSLSVLPGVSAEGVRIVPKGSTQAAIICLPDADDTPEAALDRLHLPEAAEVFILQLISRGSEYSVNPRYGVRTNIPHREWIYRQAFVQGRTPVGYEVQKVLAAVDWLTARGGGIPIAVMGEGEGGLVALHAGALDERIFATVVSGYFGPREEIWREPIERNLFGLLANFGDAEVGSLIAPRKLAVGLGGYPVLEVPPVPASGIRAVAAPGKLWAVSPEAVSGEVERARRLKSGEWLSLHEASLNPGEVAAKVLGLKAAQAVKSGIQPDLERLARQLAEIERHAQSLFPDGEAERESAFWRKLPLSNPEAYSVHIQKEQQRFWREVIGKLPDPDVPMNARSRVLFENDKVGIYEVTMDVWEDVFVWGWLCIPKGIGSGERRPVVVCQHGLEGLPGDVFNDDSNSKAFKPYQAFALRLAEQGYVTFAPHNPYRGGDAFRTLQRKLNPLGLTLYSVINGQHQRILEWLGSQPFVNKEKIAFYGLSYGGKSAMRTPSVLAGYCLSICSGDFNEWVRKVGSLSMPMSYVHTPEYEISEWNLGRTFSYAEMAALIAPRPFMVERGHRDGVGMDEWVSFEYAKVRRLYDALGVKERARIEYFDAGHTIHGVGTFEFLHENLGR